MRFNWSLRESWHEKGNNRWITDWFLQTWPPDISQEHPQFSDVSHCRKHSIYPANLANISFGRPNPDCEQTTDIKDQLTKVTSPNDKHTSALVQLKDRVPITFSNARIELWHWAAFHLSRRRTMRLAETCRFEAECECVPLLAVGPPPLPSPPSAPYGPCVHGQLLSCLIFVMSTVSPLKHTTLFLARVSFSTYLQAQSGWELGNLLNCDKKKKSKPCGKENWQDPIRVF